MLVGKYHYLLQELKKSRKLSFFYVFSNETRSFDKLWQKITSHILKFSTQPDRISPGERLTVT